MVVGVHRLVAPEGQPFGPGDQIADHLIHVHVRLGATAGLPDLQGELIVVLASGNGGRGFDDPVTARLIQHP